MPAGLGTLFAGLLLIVLAFVEGSSVWKALHEVLFGLFGCGSFVLGAAICYLAILYTRGEDLIGQMFKLMLGLVFASGTVIVFSEIPADIPAARMVAERRPCLAGRRCHRYPAGRQSAAALRASGGQSRDGGAGALCQPVHF